MDKKDNRESYLARILLIIFSALTTSILHFISPLGIASIAIVILATLIFYSTHKYFKNLYPTMIGVDNYNFKGLNLSLKVGICLIFVMIIVDLIIIKNNDLLTIINAIIFMNGGGILIIYLVMSIFATLVDITASKKTSNLQVIFGNLGFFFVLIVTNFSIALILQLMLGGFYQ